MIRIVRPAKRSPQFERAAGLPIYRRHSRSPPLIAAEFDGKRNDLLEPGLELTVTLHDTVQRAIAHGGEKLVAR